MSFWIKIKNGIAANLSKILNKEVFAKELVLTPNQEMGDLGWPIFALAKELGRNPAELAKEIAKKYPTENNIKAKATGPYLNFVINKKYLAKNIIKEIEEQKEKYGHNENLKNKKIMVEFAHPNPFKSFHIGHLRNILLGESIVRVLEAQGAKVIRTNYQGDIGMHIAKCLWSFQKIDSKDYPTTTDLKVALLGKCYAEGSQAFENIPEAQAEIKEINKKIYSGEDEKIKNLWTLGKNWSLEKFHEIYQRVYSHFDCEYMESEMITDCREYIKQAEVKGILEKSDGAIVFKGEKHGLETRVFLNSEGLPTYEGKELALAYREFSDFGKIDLCIHNVAVEQKSFFAATFKVEELLDEKRFKGKQYHNAYEFVGLKKGKMSSRLGNVILGNDILNEAKENIKKIIAEKNNSLGDDKIEIIAVAAVKYAFLKISAFKYLAFDMEESINLSGNSGPYILYTYARIQSIFKKIINHKTLIINTDFEKLSDTREFSLIKKLAIYSEIIEAATKNYDPSEIAKYIYELAQMLNDYYHAIPILQADEETKNARLALLNSISQVIKNGLGLLGIEVVEEM
ncbi:MAG: arginine--tRNA ligase [Patescibacteria group bacterium]|jgi:arginyl-tRNA synthetase